MGPVISTNQLAHVVRCASHLRLEVSRLGRSSRVRGGVRLRSASAQVPALHNPVLRCIILCCVAYSCVALHNPVLRCIILCCGA